MREKSFFILIDEGRSVTKQSSIPLCSKKHFCEMLLSIFNIQGILKSLVSWFSSCTKCMWMICYVQDVDGVHVV